MNKLRLLSLLLCFVLLAAGLAAPVLADADEPYFVPGDRPEPPLNQTWTESTRDDLIGMAFAYALLLLPVLLVQLLAAPFVALGLILWKKRKKKQR